MESPDRLQRRGPTTVNNISCKGPLYGPTRPPVGERNNVHHPYPIWPIELPRQPTNLYLLSGKVSFFQV